jgi:hypothetical protein
VAELMAKYVATNKEQVLAALQKIKERNLRMLKQIQSNMPRVMMNAGQIIEARAKEIITEKGHIVTGNLRRSINTQLGEVSATRIEVLVGTWVEYAPFVEALPDGGFLFPAAIESLPAVNRYLAVNGILPTLIDWGRP